MRSRDAPLDPAAQTPRGRNSGGGRAGGGDEENGENVDGQAYPAGQRVPDAIRNMAVKNRPHDAGGKPICFLASTHRGCSIGNIGVW